MLKLLFKTKTMMLGCLTALLFSATTQAQMRGPMEEPFIPGHLIAQITEGAQIERITQSFVSSLMSASSHL